MRLTGVIESLIFCSVRSWPVKFLGVQRSQACQNCGVQLDPLVDTCECKRRKWSIRLSISQQGRNIAAQCIEASDTCSI